MWRDSVVVAACVVLHCVLPCVAVCCKTLQHAATHCNIQCIATESRWICRLCWWHVYCCSVLQRVALCCCVLGVCVLLHHRLSGLGKDTATNCNTLQHTATHCNTHQSHIHRCSWLWADTATRCTTLQRTATHCDTLQRTPKPYLQMSLAVGWHCNALHHTATHCNTLQHTATHCSTHQSYSRWRPWL